MLTQRYSTTRRAVGFDNRAKPVLVSYGNGAWNRVIGGLTFYEFMDPVGVILPTSGSSECTGTVFVFVCEITSIVNHWSALRYAEAVNMLFFLHNSKYLHVSGDTRAMLAC